MPNIKPKEQDTTLIIRLSYKDKQELKSYSSNLSELTRTIIGEWLKRKRNAETTSTSS